MAPKEEKCLLCGNYHITMNIFLFLNKFYICNKCYSVLIQAKECHICTFTHNSMKECESCPFIHEKNKYHEMTKKIVNNCLDCGKSISQCELYI